MSKKGDPKKLEIVLSPEMAEKLYQAILQLVAVFDLNNNTVVRSEILEEALLKNYLEKKLKEREIDISKGVQEKISRLAVEIKSTVTKDVGEALEKLRSNLVESSGTNNSVIVLLSKYNRIIKGALQGIIDFQIADQEINKIVNALLYIVDNLDEESLKK